MSSMVAEGVPRTDVGGIADELRRQLAADRVITDLTRLKTYECDGITGYRVVPALVALPESTEEVAQVVAACAGAGLPYVARGAGTGLSGGALPVADGVVISLARMRRVLEIDPANQRMTVEPGVTNADITRAVAAQDLYFAPDPSSQTVCTIGGNIAENSGGAHCMKYGFTTNHVHAMTLVLPDASVVTVGGDGPEVGPDLRGAVIGSEGTLAIATSITVRLLRKPEAVRTLVADFPSAEAAGEAVSGIIAAGIIPAAVEMLDALAIEAGEAAVQAGFSLDTAAALVVELDGPEQECDDGFAEVERICRSGRHDTRPHRRRRGRAHADLEGPQGGVRGHGAHQPRLLRAGRRHPRTRLGEVLAPDAGDGRRGRPPRGQRLPRRRRQPAPAGALQRRGARRVRARGAPVHRDRGALRRDGRFDHRGARCRHGQGLLDAQDVQRGRPRGR